MAIVLFVLEFLITKDFTPLSDLFNEKYPMKMFLESSVPSVENDILVLSILYSTSHLEVV